MSCLRLGNFFENSDGKGDPKLTTFKSIFHVLVGGGGGFLGSGQALITEGQWKLQFKHDDDG